ncbi:MAG TPA: hypothetical protein VGE98_05285 [Thermoanaerobaculia bacterium]
MADDRLGTFLELSVALTGFSTVELQGTGMAQAYLETLAGAAGEGVTADLLRTFAEVERGGDVERELRTRILGDPRLGPVARNLIGLWYVGSWYELPQAWRDANGISAGDVSRVVSAQSYQQGLMWLAGGAHAQGANEPGYGTWARPPRAGADS